MKYSPSSHPHRASTISSFRKCLLNAVAADADRPANCLAALAVAVGWSILWLNHSPIPAGADTLAIVRHGSKSPQSVIHLVQFRPNESPENEPGDVVSAVEVLDQDPAISAMERKLSLLEEGAKFLTRVPNYSAHFTKQELVNDTLLGEQELLLKVQHEPLSVSLRWLTGNTGRQAMYSASANDGKMLVREPGWKWRLGIISLDPHGSLATGESRYPIMQCGIKAITDMMLLHTREDLKTRRFAKCEFLEDQNFDERPCYTHVIEYASNKVSPVYRKAVTLIDKEWKVPVYTKNFGWSNEGANLDPEELDCQTLIEFYSFSNIQFNAGLVADDFDRQQLEQRIR